MTHPCCHGEHGSFPYDEDNDGPLPYVYRVEVVAPTQALADRVMMERIEHDEELLDADGEPFSYRIDWERPVEPWEIRTPAKETSMVPYTGIVPAVMDLDQLAEGARAPELLAELNGHLLLMGKKVASPWPDSVRAAWSKQFSAETGVNLAVVRSRVDQAMDWVRWSPRQEESTDE